MATSGHVPAKVLVVGNCTLDIAFRLPRFPAPGETLIADEHHQDTGGKGANQAVAAARCGVPVALCATIGNDEAGALFQRRLSAEGIDLSYLVEVGAPTDLSIIYVTPGGENCIVSSCATSRALRETDVDQAIRRAEPAAVVLLQGNLSARLTRQALALARDRGLVTVLNPAPIHYPFDEMWPLVNHVVLNEIEVAQLTGCGQPTEGAAVLLERGASHVLVTLGAKGAVSATADGAVAIRADSVEAVDSTGAGDVCCGVFAAAVALGLERSRAARLAVDLATLSVTRPGTQTAFPTHEEVNRLMASVNRDDG